MRAMIFVLAACAHGTGTDGGDGAATFKILYPDSPYKTRVGKKLYVKPVGQCVYTNGRDARWSMTGARFEGEAPGFVIEDGVISGTPKHAGSWTLHVKFSGVLCAGQAHDPQVVDVTITAS